MLTRVHVFALLLLAPFLGIILALLFFSPFQQVDVQSVVAIQKQIKEETGKTGEQLAEWQDRLNHVRLMLNSTEQLVYVINQATSKELQVYEEQKKMMDYLVEESKVQGERSADLLDKLLATMLGEPIGQTFGERATVKVYSLKEAGYRGYMAKVRLHDPSALKLVLAEDKVRSRGETTSAAAKRSGAILAINAGGFQTVNGELAPLGITVIDGEIVTFSQSDLSFVGFNKAGHLVGGRIASPEQIKELGIVHGASFLPTLLKDGKKQPIPSAWANTRHPRTLIGHFKNGDLLFVVIDGRQKGWSNGVTLEEAQEKLLQFNVRDAYNLDGGGSSTFYYNGRVLNRPSEGKERRVTTNFVVLP